MCIRKFQDHELILARIYTLVKKIIIGINMKYLLVIAYKSRRGNYEPRWQIIERDGRVVHTYMDRKEALKAIVEFNK
jgi:hypothetical protein